MEFFCTGSAIQLVVALYPLLVPHNPFKSVRDTRLWIWSLLPSLRLSGSVELVVRVLLQVLEMEVVFLVSVFGRFLIAKAFNFNNKNEGCMYDISSRSVRGYILAEEILYGQTTTAPDFFLLGEHCNTLRAEIM